MQTNRYFIGDKEVSEEVALNNGNYVEKKEVKFGGGSKQSPLYMTLVYVNGSLSKTLNCIDSKNKCVNMKVFKCK